jgi:exonuclease III
VASFNIEGIRNNSAYLREIEHGLDMVFVQEHWLFHCERNIILDHSDLPHGMAKAVDLNNPITPWRLPRGYGGVGLLWKHQLHHMLTVDPSIGSERILVAKYKCGLSSITFINCYMPSGNGAKIKEEYLDTIQRLNCILDASKTMNGTIILVGDMNVDLFRRCKKYDSRRQELTALLKRHNLVVLLDGTTPTMWAHDGRSKSVIDIVAVEAGTGLMVDVAVSDKVPWNTSCHVPLTLEITIAHNTEPNAHTHIQLDPTVYKQHPKVFWSTLDRQRYQEFIQDALVDKEVNLLEPTDIASLLSSTITQGVQMAAEVKKPAKRRERKVRLPKPVIDSMKKSRIVHLAWKRAGRPNNGHPLAKLRRKSAKAVRAAQRKHNAQKRQRKHKDITKASTSDQALFHRLVTAHQRSKDSLSPLLSTEGHHITDPAGILDRWADHFESLATPPQSTMGDGKHLERAEELVELHTYLWKTKSMESTTVITEKEVEEAIQSLNPGKAPDELGIAAEHLKYGGQPLLHPLCVLLNKIISSGSVPEELKDGRKIPVPKKDKSTLHPGNYRGITITSLYAKLLERVISRRIQSYLPRCSLQFGFTSQCAPTLAAVCLTEAIVQSNRKHPLIVVSLDAEKAFDRVNIATMLSKLAMTNIPMDTWAAVQSLYNNPKEFVATHGFMSRTFSILQGVRQGAVMSTDLYKLYLHNLLSSLDDQDKGFAIGDITISAPTCADDVLLLASNELDMQELLDQVAEYARDHQYSLNPTKTTLTYYNTKPSGPLYLGSEVIKETTSYVHLGIERTTTGHAKLMNGRVLVAQRTVYALIPSGMYGQDGLSPVIMRKLLSAYVIPRMMHGLETLILTQGDVDKLERGYKNILRNLMSLRKNIASSAVYLMMGQLPIEAELHLRILTLYGMISRQDDQTAIKQLARRQLATQTNPCNSWFGYVASIAKSYDLYTSIHSALEIKFSKEEWSGLIKKAITDTWFHRLKRDAIQRTSLRYLDINLLIQGEAHPLWPETAHTYGIQSAGYRAKMVTGTYILQANRARFNQFTVDPTCTLCNAPVEDLPHFITECSALDTVRRPIMVDSIEPMALKLGLTIPDGREPRCRFILNGGLAGVPRKHQYRRRTATGGDNRVDTRILAAKFQSVCSSLCFKLHQRRVELLTQANQP